MERFEELEQLLAKRCPTLELRKNESMERNTSFHVGGPARMMALPRTKGEAKSALLAAAELGIEPFFLGNGTNLLVPDRGVERFLIKPVGKYGVDELNRVWEANGLLCAGAAVSLANLSGCALGRNLTGLEFAQGIPGSVGGGVTMNAGAYGGELAQVIESVTVLFPDEGVRTLNAGEMAFSYRHSLLTERPEAVVLRAAFRLQPGKPEEIRKKMDELMARRKASQPLEYPSAGSTFKRPEGYYAAALIDQCGLKGLTVGGAQVSEKHAGFVINRGSAACADVTALMAEIQRRVKAQTGVELEPEVRVIK